jgi:hypothetical protein
MSKLRVFTFGPDWSLPTVGPFAFKLLAWLELASLPYEQVVEENPRKDPKGKIRGLSWTGIGLATVRSSGFEQIILR